MLAKFSNSTKVLILSYVAEYQNPSLNHLGIILCVQFCCSYMESQNTQCKILPIVHHSLPVGVQCHQYNTNFCLPSHSSVHSTSSLAEPHRHFLSHDHHNRSHDPHRLVPHNKFDSKKLVVHLKIKLQYVITIRHSTIVNNLMQAATKTNMPPNARAHYLQHRCFKIQEFCQFWKINILF